MNKDFWKGKKVLITGHTGFKGSWLLLWLSNLGADVTGFSLEPPTIPNLFSQLKLEENLKYNYICNILDFSKLLEATIKTKPDIVFHLAAQPLVRQSYEDPRKTWRTNVEGSINILEAIKNLNNTCTAIMVTTDKVYENREWDFGYRETDRLGGYDPYSASKAAAEIGISSWRSSFCGSKPHQFSNLEIATVRSGNVIGGGDWSDDRIFPDAMRSLALGQTIPVRNPSSTRPWQHVLEPLSGYLLLAEKLYLSHSENSEHNPLASAFNFGPKLDSNRTVKELVEEILCNWDGNWKDLSKSNELHEAKRLHLQLDKSHHLLGWRPRWSFEESIRRTTLWYKSVNQNSNNAIKRCLTDLNDYQSQEKA